MFVPCRRHNHGFFHFWNPGECDQHRRRALSGKYLAWRVAGRCPVAPALMSYSPEGRSNTARPSTPEITLPAADNNRCTRKGKIVRYDVDGDDKKFSVLCFGAKGEWKEQKRESQRRDPEHQEIHGPATAPGY